MWGMKAKNGIEADTELPDFRRDGVPRNSEMQVPEVVVVRIVLVHQRLASIGTGWHLLSKKRRTLSRYLVA
jgi:hypothetical protein